MKRSTLAEVALYICQGLQEGRMFTQLVREANHVCVYSSSCEPYTACVEVLQTLVPKSSGGCPNLVLEYSTITMASKLGPYEGV